MGHVLDPWVMDIWMILRRCGCENCRTIDISCSWGWQNHSDPPLVIGPLMNIRRRRFILIHLIVVILLWLPSILNINELVFVLFHRGWSRIVKSFLFFIWARGNIHPWFLRHKWRRGCVVQSCSRRLECDWNMPGSYPLSVHLYLIWLILILINGTIWPDIETVPHCVRHSYLMRWIFITLIVIWGRLPALQIWFYNLPLKVKNHSSKSTWGPGPFKSGFGVQTDDLPPLSWGYPATFVW